MPFSFSSIPSPVCLSFSKNAFDSVNGFDEELVACEDYDIHNRLLEKGFRIGRINSKEIHLGEPKTLLEIIKKVYYYFPTIGKYIEKNPQRAKLQFRIIRPAYTRNWKLFLKNPILTIGFIIMKGCEFGALGFRLIKNER